MTCRQKQHTRDPRSIWGTLLGAATLQPTDAGLRSPLWRVLGSAWAVTAKRCVAEANGTTITTSAGQEMAELAESPPLFVQTRIWAETMICL